MAYNRYSKQPVLTNEKMSTFPNVRPEELYSEDDIFIKLRYSQRIDHIAYQYLGDGKYWWVICLMNGLKTPFERNLVVGKLLRVPTSLNKVIQTIENRQNG